MNITRLSGHAVTRILLVGFGAVLLLFAVVAVGGSVVMHETARQVERSGDLAGAYLRAQDAFSREDLVEDAYNDGSVPRLRPEFAAAARDLDAALADLDRLGGPADRALAREAMPLHARYVAGMREIMDAQDRGDADAAEEANDESADPAQDELQPLISGTGPTYALAQLERLDQLKREQDVVFATTLVGAVVGAALYALLLVFFTALRRRLDSAARAELAATRELALTDDLTGLGNRRQLYAAADADIARVAGGGASVAMLVIDVDRFKEINDTLGHQVGDRLLCELASRLRDSMPQASVLARLGGDEFVALLPGDTGEAEATRAAERFQASLDRPFSLEGLEVGVRASIGLAVGPAHGSDRPTLMRHADTAMYRAKAAGGGIKVYASESDANSVERLQLTSELRAAIARGELVLHYQPKVSMTAGTVDSVEALVRWAHPERGLLPPAAFLPIAEQQGLMREITLHVLEVAMDQVEAWRRDGRTLRVAVNVAMANLLDVRFPDEIRDMLARHGTPPEMIQLEITEETVMTDPVRVLDVLARLSEMGLSLALDDFGTGYSSLAYLKRLPVQELKIDRSFVIDMERSHDDTVIVRSTVELARNLGLHVVAEGVETQETWDQLVEFGCDTAQGYLLSPPLPPERLDAWLRERAARERADEGAARSAS